MEQISESVRQGQEHRLNRTRQIKQIVLAVVSVGLLSLNWWFLDQALFADHPASYWVWPIFVTALWIGATSMFALANPHRYLLLGVNIISLVTFVLIFPQEILVITGGLIFVVMHVFFQKRIQDEENNQLNFSFRRTLANSQGLMTYALLILIGFLVYSNVDQDFQRDPDGFYRRLGEGAVQSLPYVSQNNDRFNLSQSVDDYFRAQAEQDYPDFEDRSPQQQEIIVDQFRENFSRQFGVDADQNSSIKVALTEVVVQRLQEALGRYEPFFPLFFTIAIIALLRTASFVFSWLTLFISWIIYRTLLISRFFRLQKQTVEVEKLEI